MGVCHGSTRGDVQCLQKISGRHYQVQVRVDAAGRDGNKSEEVSTSIGSQGTVWPTRLYHCSTGGQRFEKALE